MAETGNVTTDVTKSIDDTITSFMAENKWCIISYIIIATFIIIRIAIKHRTRKKTYMRLKEISWNVWFVSGKHEVEDDKFINDLLEDNEWMSQEIKLLGKKYNDLSFSSGMFAFMVLLWIFISNKIKRNT